MERINRIINHPVFRESLEKTAGWEAERRFCRHDTSHLLDVARILWIFNLERKLGYGKETLYAAALLHDIGRWVQYEDGTRHGEAGSRLAFSILKDCGFSTEETSMITDAIRTHSDTIALDIGGLNTLLYEADKKSRLCLFCLVKDECNWSGEEKNLEIQC